jgi:hypothetical protein
MEYLIIMINKPFPLTMKRIECQDILKLFFLHLQIFMEGLRSIHCKYMALSENFTRHLLLDTLYICQSCADVEIIIGMIKMSVRLDLQQEERT